jgi:hypothetical protein
MITGYPKRYTKMRLILIASLCFLAVCWAKDDKNKELGTVIGIDLGTTYSW